VKKQVAAYTGQPGIKVRLYERRNTEKILADKNAELINTGLFLLFPASGRAA
jgi:hypothetical protein